MLDCMYEDVELEELARQDWAIKRRANDAHLHWDEEPIEEDETDEEE